MPPTEPRTSGRDIHRIKNLLRRDIRPTPAEMKELETLLSGTDDTELMALTSDPRHENVLQHYIRFLRRRTLRTFGGFAVIVVAVVLATILLAPDQFQ